MTDWNKESIEALLEAYKTHPNLYNSKHPQYYNRICRKESLEEIMTEVSKFRPNITVDDCQKKFNSLRSYYVQVKNKMKKKLYSRIEDSQEEVCVWWFSKIDFLKDHIQSRKTSSNILRDILNTPPLEDNSFCGKCDEEILPEYDCTSAEATNSSRIQEFCTVEIDEIKKDPLSLSDMSSSKRKYEEFVESSGKLQKSTLDNSGTYPFETTFSTFHEMVSKINPVVENKYCKFLQFLAEELESISENYILATKHEIIQTIMKYQTLTRNQERF